MKKINAGEIVFHTKDGNSVGMTKNERSITLSKNRTLRGLVFAILLSIFLLPAAAHAQPCNAVVGTTVYLHINDALAAIGTGPGTISVTGTCSESVQINDARNITIVGLSGASVLEPNDNDAFDIMRSQGIKLVNLDISSTGPDAVGVNIGEISDVYVTGCNIHNNRSGGVDVTTSSVLFLGETTIQNNTPNDGLDVFDGSSVYVHDTTIQNNGVPMFGSAGVFLARSSVVVFRQANLVQNNADNGIHARIQSTVIFAGVSGKVTTVEGNLTNGVILEEGSHLQLNRFSSLIQGNGFGAACPLDPTCGGIFATQDSHVDLGRGIVSENHGFGVSVQQGSNVQLSGATVSNNTGDGVHIQWLSIGNFLPGNSITGNGGASIFCAGRSFALGNLSGFSNVRCGEN